MNIVFLSATVASLVVGRTLAAAPPVQPAVQVLPAGVKKTLRPTEMAAVVPRPSPRVIVLSTNTDRGSRVWQVLEHRGMLEGPLSPGLYKTEPYSCLVLVPGRPIDEKSIVKPSLPSPPMPRVSPGLEFIPWPPQKAPQKTSK